MQIWDANMHQLRETAWRGFVERLATNQFQPDIITFQDLSRCDGNGDGADDTIQIRDQLNQVLGAHWDFRHTDASRACDNTRNAVFWNSNRFSLSTSPTEWDPAGCASGSDHSLAVLLNDKKNTTGVQKFVVAASLHLDPGLGSPCLSSALHETHVKISGIYFGSDLYVVGGDFNQNPDLDSATAAANGLEADPDCWYRRFSAAHANTTTVSQTSCGSTQSDQYYDSTWLYPLSGGGTNPTATSFCQQYTYSTTLSLGTPDAEDVENSCTDENLDGNPDKKRIDQIWLRWGTSQNPLGGATPIPVTIAASHLLYASADTGLRLNSSLSRYSDHRAVQALVQYPALSAPL
ncbi:MAG TPA: hypothetical protein VG318_05270 [Actinomycetota bacterium]|nr:hypothetical protein [Actinomycetota bacterium]